MRRLRGGFGAVTCRHVLAARVESHPVDPGSQVDRPGGQEDLAIRSDQDLERDGLSVSATSRETQNEVGVRRRGTARRTGRMPRARRCANRGGMRSSASRRLSPGGATGVTDAIGFAMRLPYRQDGVDDEGVRPRSSGFGQARACPSTESGRPLALGWSGLSATRNRLAAIHREWADPAFAVYCCAADTQNDRTKEWEWHATATRVELVAGRSMDSVSSERWSTTSRPRLRSGMGSTASLGIGLAGVPCVRGATLAEAVAIRRVRARGRRLRLGRHTGPLPMLSLAPVSTETPSSPERGDRDDRGDFIRDIVAADLASRPAQDHRHPLPAGAERLSAYRPRQVDLPQFRHRPGIRRPLPSALRRHQPDQGGAGIHRRHRARRALARLRLGRAPLPRLGLFRAALRLGRSPHPRRQGLCRRPDADEIRAHPRHA